MVINRKKPTPVVSFYLYQEHSNTTDKWTLFNSIGVIIFNTPMLLTLTGYQTLWIENVLLSCYIFQDYATVQYQKQQIQLQWIAGQWDVITHPCHVFNSFFLKGCWNQGMAELLYPAEIYVMYLLIHVSILYSETCL